MPTSKCSPLGTVVIIINPAKRLLLSTTEGENDAIMIGEWTPAAARGWRSHQNAIRLETIILQ